MKRKNSIYFFTRVQSWGFASLHQYCDSYPCSGRITRSFLFLSCLERELNPFPLTSGHLNVTPVHILTLPCNLWPFCLAKILFWMQTSKNKNNPTWYVPESLSNQILLLWTMSCIPVIHNTWGFPRIYLAQHRQPQSVAALSSFSSLHYSSLQRMLPKREQCIFWNWWQES